ncbi:aspartic peptidase A1 family [Artemisia annua]|uniref:Aspartic peptidase A1 family n=1 Tax=Artemisia annua TaxID=35608 RepID=A0A2U1PPL4_ARTAN|nr:aspartic peptidase A1 family [Artemisia annua]
MAFSSFAIAITLAILYTAGCNATANSDTFSIDLIHRDSVDSPFYDSSMNFSQRVGHAIKRSIIHSKHLNAHHNPKRSTYQTQIIPDHGEFLLNISYGNPPQRVLAIADTGSDLSWIQCEPCIHCYNQTGSLFYPNRSSTYKPVACDTDACKVIGSIDANCSLTRNCPYDAAYGDGSTSNGTISTETVTLGDRVLQDIAFGCGFYNDGVFRPTQGGIVGLGGGDLSLVSQIRAIVPGKFSYCLIPFTLKGGISNKSSKMIFGNIDFGPNAVSTPLLPILPNTYYYVALEVTRLPKVTLHFDGADVEMNRDNLFVPVSNHIMCLAIRSSAGGLPVMGNIAQMNYIVGFDLDNNLVSFKRTDCEKL